MEAPVDSTALRAAQQPLKDAYRKDPREAVVTLRAVATSLQIPVTAGTVYAEGELDFRGTLAVTKDAPVGFTSIRLGFELDTDASDEQIATLVSLTERYCVVYQTLAHPAKVSASVIPKAT